MGACHRNGSCMIFAHLAGFVGDERQWQQEFLELCKESGIYDWIIDIH